MRDFPKPKKKRSDAAKTYSLRQEKGLATRYGGVKTPGSGNQKQKGDVRIRNVSLIEAKATTHRSFSITQTMIQKLVDATMSTGEIPSIVVDFISDGGSLLYSVSVIPTSFMEEIFDAYRKKENE